MQTVHHSCTNANNVSKQIETKHMTHVTMEFHRVPPILFSSPRYVRHKSCTNLAPRVALSPNRQNRASTCALSPRSLSSASKTISMPTVCLVQTVHLSCTDSNTVPKRTKSRFHTTHVTYEFHRVRPKLFMSLWYVQCKPCTCLVSRLALYQTDQTELHLALVT
jgi:hypothetical protein